MSRSLSKKIRFEVFKRDEFTCRYCGKGTTAGAVLEVDHVIPVVEGGPNITENLVTACFDCNRGKGKTILSEKNPALLSRKDLKKMIQIQREQVDLFLEYQTSKVLNVEIITENAVRPLLNVYHRRYYPMPKAYQSSVKDYISKIGYDQVHDAASLAADFFEQRRIDEPFKYFYGICRNKAQKAASCAL